ncbi:MAG TPA: S1/P1 nuclease [Candidatus Angelobacter sp.]
MNYLARSRSQVRLAVTLCLFLLVSQGIAWGPGGHMIVAKIAYDRLNPHAKAEVDRLIKVSINPEDVTAKSPDFVNAAHWPDDLRSVKSDEFKPTFEWHFVDTPFSPDNTELPDLPEPNIISALNDEVKVLKSSDASDQDKARALRFLIHFVGDIHQPLHCATQVTEKNPDGDRGGNLFILRMVGANGRVKKVKLHSYWDGGIDKFPKGGPPPEFAPPSLDDVSSAAADIINQFPDTDPQWKAGGPFNFDGWAKESFDLAQSVAYDHLVPDGQPTAAYKKKAIKTTRERVAWGGYRLAELLNNIWPAQ